jgi:hypothetical protein
MTEPVYHDKYAGCWKSRHPRHKDKPFVSKTEAAKAYVEALVAAEPKYKDLFKNKSWTQIFRIVGITI